MGGIPLPALLGATTLPDVAFGTAQKMRALQQQKLLNQIKQAQAGIAPQLAQAQLQQAQLVPGLTQAQTEKTQAEASALPGSSMLKQLKLMSDIASGKSLQSLREAKIKKIEKALKDPLSGKKLTGSAAETESLERAKKIYGEDSPIYQMALEKHNVDLETKKAMGQKNLAQADYYHTNVAFKNLNPLQKNQLMLRYQKIQADRQKNNLPTFKTFDDWWATQQQGQAPGVQAAPVVAGQQQGPQAQLAAQPGGALGQEPAPHPVGVTGEIPKENQVQPYETPENFEEESKQSEASMRKMVSDPVIIRKAYDFQVINQLISKVSRPMLERYTGIKGKLNLAADRVRSQAGEAVPMYEAFEAFRKTGVLTIADKARQSYGTTVDPKMIKWLKEMANPTGWLKTPRVMMASWNKLQQLMQEQGAVYNEAAQGHFSKNYIGAPGQELPGAPTQTPAEQQAALKQGAKSLGKITDARWKADADKEGMTVEELKQKVRDMGVTWE